MKLIEVHVVGAKQAQGFFEQLGAAIFRPIFFLASQENVLAVRLKSRPQARLRVPIAGRHIKVADAVVNRLRHDIVGKRLAVVHHHDPAKAHDGKLFSGLSQLPPRNGLRVIPCLGRLSERGENLV